MAVLEKFLSRFKIAKPSYRIISKRFNKETQQFFFTIENDKNERFIRTANQLSREKQFLDCMNVWDVYDIGYTQGSESILKEKIGLMEAKLNQFEKA